MARFKFLPEAIPITFSDDSGFVVAQVTEGDHLGEWVVRLDSTGEHIFIPDKATYTVGFNRGN